MGSCEKLQLPQILRLPPPAGPQGVGKVEDHPPGVCDSGGALDVAGDVSALDDSGEAPLDDPAPADHDEAFGERKRLRSRSDNRSAFAAFPAFHPGSLASI